MSDRERKFRELLKANGVTKCYVENVDFNDIQCDGRILIDNPDSGFLLELYKLFTNDPDGVLDNDQLILIRYDTFEKYKPNYKFRG